MRLRFLGMKCRKIEKLITIVDNRNRNLMKYPTLGINKDKDLKFRKWFKNGLKAQKLLAQGVALGIIAISKAPCKGKSLIYCLDF